MDMNKLTPYTNINTLTPSDAHAVDMDYRADWNESDVNDPSYINNKPNVADPSDIPNIPSAPAKASAVKTYILKVATNGTVTWTEIPAIPAKAAADKTYLLKVTSGGVLSWVESDVYTTPSGTE